MAGKVSLAKVKIKATCKTAAKKYTNNLAPKLKLETSASFVSERMHHLLLSYDVVSNETTIKNIANMVQAGTLCCVELGRSVSPVNVAGMRFKDKLLLAMI